VFDYQYRPAPKAQPTDATNSGVSQSEYTQFLSTIAKSPALITGYSKLLKSAGYYKGKITDKYTPALQKAFTAVELDYMCRKAKVSYENALAINPKSAEIPSKQ
jgi:hypothetical protein